MNKIKRIINNPYWLFYYFLLATKVSRITPDKWYLKLQYRCFFNKKLNLINPKSFNEKLQWLKLYDRKPEYIKMVDKHEVKKYVTDIIGKEYIIPTLGIWDNFDDIDFDKLPMQFVLKCTHDSGSTIICRDKSKFNFNSAKNKISKFLLKNPYLPGREWVYKGVKPRIIAEKFMLNGDDPVLNDYKFFCFDGEPKCLFVGTDRHLGDKNVKFDFYDSDFNHLDIVQIHEQSGKQLKKPQSFEDMLSLSRLLSVNIPHVRVDFYEIDNKPYFGELTFFHHGGTVPFKTEEWDYKLGSMLELPLKKVY
jgi:hypothetical protein